MVRPGGKIVIVDYHRPARWHPMRPLMRAVFRKLEPYAIDLWRHEIEHFLPEASPPASMHKRDFFRRAVPEAGADPLRVAEQGTSDAGSLQGGRRHRRRRRRRPARGHRRGRGRSDADAWRSISKVYPMRSHTVAAEGGAAARDAGARQPGASLQRHRRRRRLAVRPGRGRVLRRPRARGDGAAGALGLPVEPQGRRPRQRARLRRHEDRAHLVRRRQDRLPHAAHAVPDLAQVPVDQALRRVLLRRPAGRGRPLRRAWWRSTSRAASSG